MTSTTIAARDALPSDWKRLGILDLVSIRNGQVDPRRPEYRDLPLIAPDHVDSGTGRLLKIMSARAQGAISGKYLVAPGDVIYSKIRPYLQKAVKCDFAALCSADMYPLTPKPGVDSSFVLHTLLGEDFTKFATSVSARSGIPKINRAELAEYVFPVPPMAEQKAISTVLNEIDQMILTLELLIAKRQAIKQGMMQELLTGRTRLPGFSDSWHFRRLHEISEFITKGSTPTTYGYRWEDSGVLFLRSECVSTHGLDLRQAMHISEEANRSLRRSQVSDGDILITITGNVGRVVRINGLGVANINQHIARIRVRDPRFDSEFVYQYLSQRSIREHYESITTGQAYPQISLTQVRNTIITAPPIQEQRKLANALKDADSQISSLERFLTKTIAVKLGMMQELLTGRTRLPAKEAVA